jgi:hypothetical protein
MVYKQGMVGMAHMGCNMAWVRNRQEERNTREEDNIHRPNNHRLASIHRLPNIVRQILK